ncbi:ATP-binding protein [Winogradskyella aquimaris]|uniref:ATP-binding protein n=1 Tax=Winogradskyella aquimaris TaxID=864074 RepID=A0ABU5ESF4_9FLAO|nr:ATP-binding protein [Winogradskyella aquimaris]MDY2588485.1 ATP-binding protein [Winogradskyella aquimaris]
MPKQIDIGVEIDHIDSLTRANGKTAISELIWNSLDADASEINIEFEKTKLGSINYLLIKDNGHGLNYQKAQDVFSKLGGSEKKLNRISPNGRHYHGKEGKGRYKSLALGDLVEFTSRYKNGESYKEYTITLDRNHLSYSDFSDLKTLPKGDYSTGFQVRIDNVNQENASQAIDISSRKELEQKFASYWINYPDFSIIINGQKLEFSSLIKHSEEQEILVNDGEFDYRFKIKIIEWSFDIKKQTYLCNTKGIPFQETNLGIRSTLPISIFIQSNYIEKLHRENRLALDSLDEILNSVIKDSKKIARDYVRRRLHQYSGKFINELKAKGLYPYKDKPDTIVEESKRQVFDIVALQVNEYLPDFETQDDKSKKLTLSLIKESLENDTTSLQRILTEVIELPEEKRNDLFEILDETSLSNIIDAMTEIKNRLNLLNGIEQLIYDTDLNKQVKERKHLHKIVVNETWIFGDKYTYGADDVTLKNVLKAYLKDAIGRDDFQEVVESEDNDELRTIPDVCLWQQFSMGSAGKENLIIELKKPNKDAGFTEKSQIESYATKVSNDPRFPKDKTRWKFLLVTKDIKPEIEPLLNQKNRRYGHVSEGDNFDVYVLPWGHILSEARTRHEFIRDKLNLNLKDNEQGLDYLKNKYKEYLPEEFK